jgi:hypothetical protein
MTAINSLDLLLRYASLVPPLLVCLAGLALAVAFRRRYPGVCLLAGLAFGLAILRLLAYPAIFLWVTSGPVATTNPLWVFRVWDWISSLIAAAQYGLLLGAIFTGRRGTLTRRADLPPRDEARPAQLTSTAFTADPP